MVAVPLGFLLIIMYSLQPRPAFGQSDIIWQPTAQDFEQLDRTFQSYVNEIGCRQVLWQADFTSLSSYHQSLRPLRVELEDRLGPLPQSLGGQLIEENPLVETESYKISWVRVTSRLAGVSVFGYWARPNGAASSYPAIILLHGDGAPPHTAFGWRLPGDEWYVSNADRSSFVNAGAAFAAAGYAVFVPWLGDERTRWLPWYEMERWSTLLAKKQGAGSGLSFLVPQVMASLDFVLTDPLVQPHSAAILGWSQGALVAAVAAALDPRIKFSVWLEPPTDKRRWRLESREGQEATTAFEHVDCTLGHLELAALVAPRPLLFSFSPKDIVFERYATSSTGSYLSADVYTATQAIYAGLAFTDHLSQVASSDVFTAGAIVPLQWLNHLTGFSPATLPNNSPAPTPTNWVYPAADHMKGRNEVGDYLASFGSCPQVQVSPDFSSITAFHSSMEELRVRTLHELTNATLPPQQPVVVIEQRLVTSNPVYKLEWVRFRGRFTHGDNTIGGYLATPHSGPSRKPTVLSMMGYEKLNWSFGLEDPGFPYLNAYGDYLARQGYIVFIPYISYDFDRWGAVLRVRTNHAETSWSFLLPFYQSSVDYLLTRPDVDASRIAAYGLSFGGLAALYATAFDARISALLYSNPMFNFELISAWSISILRPLWLTDLCTTYDKVLPLLVAPRRLIMENGALEWNEQQYYPMEVRDRSQQVYDALGYGRRFEFVRHEMGHETRPWLFTLFYPPPAISRVVILPPEDSSHRLLEITGADFSASPLVLVDGRALSITLATSTTIQAILPNGLPDSSYNLVIENLDGYQASGIFTLESVPPIAEVLSPLGDALVGQHVTLRLLCQDNAPGHLHMRFSENPLFAGALWMPYAETASVQLSPGDGWKTIYAQCRDGSGNLSHPYSRRLLMDATPPSGLISINGGAVHSTSDRVKMALAAVDAASGVTAVELSNNGAEFSAPITYSQQVQWTLAPGYGMRAVYARFVDGVGNRSNPVFDTIHVIDVDGREIGLSINGNAEYVNNRQISLTVVAPPGTSAMAITESALVPTSASGSRERTFVTNEIWLPYHFSVSWMLADYGDDFPQRTLQVRFLDTGGDISQTYNAHVIFDGTPPNGMVTVEEGAPYVITPTVHLTLMATDQESGVAEMRIGNTPDLSLTSWRSFMPEVDWQMEGGGEKYTVYVQYRDRAGNSSRVYSATTELLSTATLFQAVTWHWREDGALLTLDLDTTLRNVVDIQLSFDLSDADTLWSPIQREYWFAEFRPGNTLFARFRDKKHRMSAVFQLAFPKQVFVPIVAR